MVESPGKLFIIVNTGDGLDDRGKLIRFPKGAVDVSIPESVQIDPRVSKAFCSLNVAVYCRDVTCSANEVCLLPHLVLGFRIRGILISLPYALMAETMANVPLQL